MTPLIDRTMSKARQDENGCWVWLASRTPAGYGQVSALVNGKRRPVPAHRVTYEYFRAEIPVGLQLDHLCRNRACVNPWHLEPVTNRVNTIRGDAPRLARERCLSQTRCKYGHPLSGNNLHRDAAGRRRCRTCGRLRMRKHDGHRNMRRSGPMRKALGHQGRLSFLECGHTIRRTCGKKPPQLRCPRCEEHIEAAARAAVTA